MSGKIQTKCASDIIHTCLEKKVWILDRPPPDYTPMAVVLEDKSRWNYISWNFSHHTSNRVKHSKESYWILWLFKYHWNLSRNINIVLLCLVWALQHMKLRTSVPEAGKGRDNQFHPKHLWVVPIVSVCCNYLSLPLIPASGSQFLI